MSDIEAMKSAVDEYLEAALRGDAAAMADLYSDDARIEDPIGAEPIVGIAAIRSFFAYPRNVVRIERLGPVTAFKNWAAFQFRADLGAERREGLPAAVVSTELMRFDDRGKIVEMIALPDVAAAMEPTAGKTFEHRTADCATE
jgi:steroid Delta-isomerase